MSQVSEKLSKLSLLAGISLVIGSSFTLASFFGAKLRLATGVYFFFDTSIIHVTAAILVFGGYSILALPRPHAESIVGRSRLARISLPITGAATGATLSTVTLYRPNLGTQLYIGFLALSFECVALLALVFVALAARRVRAVARSTMFVLWALVVVRGGWLLLWLTPNLGGGVVINSFYLAYIILTFGFGICMVVYRRGDAILRRLRAIEASW